MNYPENSPEDELDGLLRGIAGESSAISGDELFGPLQGQSRTGARILVVDDLWEIIYDFVASEKVYANRDRSINAQFHFFRVGNKAGARPRDLIEWISEQELFEAIYIDGDLGDQGNGRDLANLIRQRPQFRYQPIAIITAVDSFFVRNAGVDPGMRIMGKFDLKGVAAIRKFVTDLPDLKAQSREIFWTDCQKSLSSELDNGLSVKQAAEFVGGQLMTHYDVSGWYLRELRGSTLDAIAMNDNCYNAGSQLSLQHAPVFQRELLREKMLKEPWITLNDLSATQVGPMHEMEGHHVIAARVGGTVGGDVTALFTAYRNSASPPFVLNDARELHHAAVLLRLTLATQRVNERLGALAEAISAVLKATSTAAIAATLCDFLHVQIQQPLEYRDHRAKTTARLFLRGSGTLERWGEQRRQIPNSLEARGKTPISITEDCVYCRAIEDDETKTSNDPQEKIKPFLSTTQQRVESYVTVPLSYDGATIGAINLESVLKAAYKRADVSLIEAVARVAAAAILNHRSQRFMTRLARLTNLAVNPAADESSDPDVILQGGANILYELCGYSDFLLFETRPDPKAPWQIVKAWHGNSEIIMPREIESLTSMQRRIDEDWNSSYLKACLDAPNESAFFSGSGAGVPDDGDGLLRPKGRRTRFHVAVLLGNARTEYSRAVMLLFEHPRPIPIHFQDVFAEFSTFLNTIYSTTFSAITNYGKALTAARIEARAGRVYAQARHTIASHLVSIYNAIDLGGQSGRKTDSIMKEVVERVQLAEQEFENSRILLKAPEPEDCNLADLWDKVTQEHRARIENSGLKVTRRAVKVQLRTDPKLVMYILFNLLDNALFHGAKNGAQNIWFDSLPEGEVGCAVCDDGGEIERSMAEKMFLLGKTTKDTGGGQGLFLSKGIAEDLQAELRHARRNNTNYFELRFYEKR